MNKKHSQNTFCVPAHTHSVGPRSPRTFCILTPLNNIYPTFLYKYFFYINFMFRNRKGKKFPFSSRVALHQHMIKNSEYVKHYMSNGGITRFLHSLCNDIHSYHHYNIHWLLLLLLSITFVLLFNSRWYFSQRDGCQPKPNARRFTWLFLSDDFPWWQMARRFLNMKFI